jgi:exosortase/archaeosortase family protein
MGWYTALQQYVAPYESRLVAVLIKIVGINAQLSPGREYSMVLLKGVNFIPVELQWNCLGWQSMIILGITLFTGLKGNFKIAGKIEAVILGLVGTFLVNLLRMAFILSLAYYWNSIAAMILHDYFASFVAIIWLIFFWWFSYSYVLESKDVN